MFILETKKGIYFDNKSMTAANLNMTQCIALNTVRCHLYLLYGLFYFHLKH